MPEGTLQRCECDTALSYHRFHLDTTNPAGFGGSGGWGLPRHPTGGNSVERCSWRHDGTGQCRGYWRSRRRRRSSRCLLKAGICEAIVREFSESDQRGLGQRGDSVNSFDWRALLADADDALGLWAGGGGQRKNVASPDKKSGKSRATSARRPGTRSMNRRSATSSPCASTPNKCARASSTSPPHRNRRASAASTTDVRQQVR